MGIGHGLEEIQYAVVQLLGLPLATGIILVALLMFIYVFTVHFRPWWIRQWAVAPIGLWTQGLKSSDADRDAPSADEVYFDVARRFLDVQISTNDELDTKSANTLQVGSVVLPLTFGLLAVSGYTIRELAIIFLLLAVFAYVILLFCYLRASNIRGLEYRPNLVALAHYSQTYDGASLRRWVAEEHASSTALNGPPLIRKARFVGLANLALVIEGALISLAAIAVLW